jgi:hypothetical protein
MEQIETQASDLRFLAQVPVLNPTSSPSLGPGSGAGRGGTPARTPGSAVGTSAGAAIAYDNQASPSSASVGDNSAHGASASNKRKSTDDGQGNAGKQTRSKRNRVSPYHFLCLHPVPDIQEMRPDETRGGVRCDLSERQDEDQDEQWGRCSLAQISTTFAYRNIMSLLASNISASLSHHINRPKLSGRQHRPPCSPLSSLCQHIKPITLRGHLANTRSSLW